MPGSGNVPGPGQYDLLGCHCRVQANATLTILSIIFMLMNVIQSYFYQQVGRFVSDFPEEIKIFINSPWWL